MDLGITNKKAIICASSKGLGKACAISLVKEGVIVTINGRNQSTINLAIQEIFELTGKEVHGVAADIRTEEGRQLL